MRFKISKKFSLMKFFFVIIIININSTTYYTCIINIYIYTYMYKYMYNTLCVELNTYTYIDYNIYELYLLCIE